MKKLHTSLVLRFSQPLPRACDVPGLREAVYLRNLTGFWVDSANGVTLWRPEEERKGEFGAFFLPLSAALDSGLLHLFCDSSFRRAAPAWGILALAARPGRHPVAQTEAW